VRIAFLNWRDLTHPEGGGAERYAQTVCAGLAGHGHDVTFLCAAHGSAPEREHLDGYRLLRQGGRMTVYPASLAVLRRLERADGPFDVVVDTQNGIPFAAPLATRSPVVSLVHHVHREQWPVVFSPAMARAGWFVESRVAPRVYRGRQYVAVSGRTRDELIELGVDATAVSVIHNGTDRWPGPTVERDERPTILVLGRLVPHKRVELAIEVLARLLGRHPGLQLRIVGDGWWHEQVAAHARALGLTDDVHLLGYVDEATKHRELARAWVALAPSAKEGWGLNVVDAASHGVPTIAHHGAGGLSESILDGVTGLLVDNLAAMTEATSRLLRDSRLRDRLGEAAMLHSRRFTWEATVASWEHLLTRVAAGRSPVAETDHKVASAILAS
jgi:glycosyltransferase involved in cell wall biosynthesis